MNEQCVVARVCVCVCVLQLYYLNCGDIWVHTTLWGLSFLMKTKSPHNVTVSTEGFVKGQIRFRLRWRRSSRKVIETHLFVCGRVQPISLCRWSMPGGSTRCLRPPPPDRRNSRESSELSQSSSWIISQQFIQTLITEDCTLRKRPQIFQIYQASIVKVKVVEYLFLMSAFDWVETFRFSAQLIYLKGNYKNVLLTIKQ